MKFDLEIQEITAVGGRQTALNERAAIKMALCAGERGFVSGTIKSSNPRMLV
jgi:hypothetical protein